MRETGAAALQMRAKLYGNDVNKRKFNIWTFCDYIKFFQKYFQCFSNLLNIKKKTRSLVTLFGQFSMSFIHTVEHALAAAHFELKQIFNYVHRSFQYVEIGYTDHFSMLQQGTQIIQNHERHTFIFKNKLLEPFSCIKMIKNSLYIGTWSYVNKDGKKQMVD